jgi:probable phosphoglycerate mutase
VLSHEHDRVEEPVIALWNAAAPELFCAGSASQASEGCRLKQRAIQRWENEGGEIPHAGRNISRP